VAANPQDIFVEVVYAFGAEAGRSGCTLGEDAAESMRALFGYSVEQAVRENPDVWVPAARRYVLKQAARIGREAARVATQTSSREITRAIFTEAAQEHVALQRLVCERAAKLEFALPSGIFCMKLRGVPGWDVR